MCLDRLQAIVSRSDPSDVPLRRFLEQVLEQVGCRLKGVLGADDPVSTVPLPAHLFRLFRDGLGDGAMCRDVALYLVEGLEEDCVRFYGWLARQAETDLDRRAFAELAQAENEVLRNLQTMLLHS